MGTALHSLIPSRFLMILAHLILCLSLLLNEKSQLIETSLPKRFSAIEAKYMSDFHISTMFMVSYNLV
ncbi:hypothetical protein PHET_02617 [Paragonimus heterotremus]|uniref:Transmembrane protein 107 n=1 Tax=Paragonimus heterotremus TaxID=100268 RepID=A0A8J4WKB5_9TREM|nr:hypothetical protein PHET_02617 [Paragonimus heterotremus]